MFPVLQSLEKQVKTKRKEQSKEDSAVERMEAEEGVLSRELAEKKEEIERISIEIKQIKKRRQAAVSEEDPFLAARFDVVAS